MRQGFINWWTVFDIKKQQKELAGLEKKSQEEDFWLDRETATKISKKISEIKEGILKIEELQREVKYLGELYILSEKDQTLIPDVIKKNQEIEKKIKSEEVKAFLSDKYDRNDAILEIFSGAGGADAQDWAAMLLRMYERYCATKGFSIKIIHQSFGEGGGPDGRIGIKAATIEVKGLYAYGYLKKESGVHRLVRISPFNAQKLRHTSFALLEVLPELDKDDEKEIEIKPEDLKIETFHASGPGGQYVNKRESAIRITHLPTGVVVSSQSERLQGSNRENAMKILYAKISQFKKAENKKELKELKGDRISASWGNQIRSYVLHPYKMVKDLRTNIESSDPAKVLDGDLEDFVEAEIKIEAR